VRRLLLVVLVSLVAAAPAAGTGSSSGVIRPGVGIGKVRLGMTLAQVRKAMGRPMYARGTSAGFGRLLIEYSYWMDGYTVFLLRSGKRTRVVSVQTTLRAERTPAGLGVGSTESQLRRAYRDLRCKDIFPKDGGIITSHDCIARTRGGRELVFSFGRQPEDDYRNGQKDVRGAPRVDWVTVREPS